MKVIQNGIKICTRESLDRRYKVRIGWWNTSLMPPRTNAIHAKNPVAVYACLERLLDRVDVLFLGETLLTREITDVLNHYNNRQRTLPSRRSFVVDVRRSESVNKAFHTLCVFDKSVVSYNQTCKIQDWLTITNDHDSKYYRVGQRYDFILPEPLSKTSFYVVHWSQYSEEDGEAMKIVVAHQLRSNMAGYSDAHIVCLGDFNCEPHAKALAVLGASRSVDYVFNRGGFFNAFWDFHANGSIDSENTRFLKTECPVFDQILINKKLMSIDKVIYEMEIVDDSVYRPLKGEHRPVLMKII